MSTLLSLIPKPSPLTSATAIVLPGSHPQSNAKQTQDEYSYSDLRSLVLSFRKVLIEQLGVRQGDVIALSMTNTLEFMIAFVGTTISRSALIEFSYSGETNARMV
jgi:acyl-CoA synthetase (AMP-forming)/AMP-acid ligase II